MKLRTKLLHLTRRLRGLGTCRDCGGPTLGGKCPACLQAASAGMAKNAAKATKLVLEIHARNQVLSTENQMLSRRLMIHELKAAKQKAAKSP